MYRFVECSKSENGKTCRAPTGVTSRSCKSMKHLPKVGKLMYVRGYVYAHSFGQIDGYQTTIYNPAVLVRGELGTIRFGGFLWGYGGTGPKGLMHLFDKLGIKGVDVPSLCNGSPDFSITSFGEWWRITFADNGKFNLEVKQTA